MSAATLTELNATITITRQPTNQWVSLNAHVTNLVTVSSTAPPITYRWHGPSGELLTGETNRSPVTLSLVLPSIQASQAGGYYVVLSDTNFGPVQSDTTTITVDPTFIKLTEGPVVTEVASSEDARWWDPDGDGWLDLFVNHTAGLGAGVLPSFFRNNRDGTFTKITTNTLAETRKRGLASAVGDFDNDGDDDLYYSGNAHPGSNEPKCDLFRNDGAGRFTAVTGPWQSDVDLTIDCTFVDYDRDGLLDIFVVNGHKATPCLYRQTPAGTFVKQTATQVGSVMIAPPESYNAGWADYDNDGDPDLWFENAQGYSRLHRNDGHGFFSLDTPTSFGQSLAGGIGSWGDCDNDGFLDLFVTGHVGYPELLYRNHGNSNHWISFKLVGTASNRSAIGAKVRVQATIFGRTYWQMREIGGGNRHQNDLRPHFGLGDSVRANRVRIEWPSGIVQELTNVAAGQILPVTEHQAGPLAPPAFAGASFAPAGFDLAIAEPTAGIVYVLEGSTVLQTWTKLMARASVGGIYEWVDEQASKQPARFYRLVVP
jgi:hypothetical protein